LTLICFTHYWIINLCYNIRFILDNDYYERISDCFHFSDDAESIEISPLLAVLMGVVGALILLAIIIIMIMKMKTEQEIRSKSQKHTIRSLILFDT